MADHDLQDLPGPNRSRRVEPTQAPLTALHEAARPAGSGQPAPAEGAGGAPWPEVPGYEVLAELGRGSMGVVYKARQKGLGRLVALKMVRTGAHAETEELNRFVAEARVLASLRHPNIIQIYEINLQQGLPYFSMELVEGGTLADLLAGRPQPFARAAGLTEVLARAIHVAHENGVVHRDLKPANVLLAAEGRASDLRRVAEEIGLPAPHGRCETPKITDFGLAKRLHAEAGATESGMVMGTPSYMAPEQAEGRSRDVGPAADVYGLGAILYEMLTGRPPFTAESPVETVLLLFQAEPVAPARLQPKLPRDLETICLKCLQKQPAKRYASALGLAEDLRRFLAGEPITARRAPVPEQVWKWARRRPALATLAACAALALVGCLALAVWHQVDLRSKLDQARADEQQARAAEAAPLSDAARYALLLNRGALRVRQGRPDRAAEGLRRAVALSPRQYQAYVNLAQAHLKSGQTEEALRQMDEAVRREPNLAALYRTRARLHALRRDHAAALADLDRAVRTGERGPALADDHLERARLLHLQKDYAAALAACAEALRLRPRDARACRLRAETLLELRRLPEALEALDDCVKFGPPDAGAFRARAALRARLGQYPGAQADYTRALEIAPDAATHTARGWGYLAADAPRLALADFAEAIRLAPDQGDAYAGRGFARVLLGEADEGVADAEEGLRRGPAAPRLLYAAARAYAQAAARAAGPLRGRRGPRDGWGERAVGLLARALRMQDPAEAAAFWQDFVQTDPTLTPVRHTPAFRELLTRYGGRAERASDRSAGAAP